MLIDTSGFYAVYSEADKHHTQAHDIYQASVSRLTTSYVLAEYVALAQARKLPRAEILSFSAEALNDETIEIVWVDEELHTKAVELLRARQDKSYSLCDAVSFVLMREHGIGGALTTDKHFEQEGFVRLLKQ
ncbi:MAG: PIN domain-containing protein [Acidobacteria bacterium]|nr:PIN domain-containing protein [Acidobacteriota bacterium]